MPARAALKLGENVRDRAIVMGGLVGLAILEIGRVQVRRSGVVIIEALVPQRFEIEKMSGIFLDRPFAVMLSGKDFGWQSADGIGQAFRRAPEPLQKFGRRLAPRPSSNLRSNQRRCVIREYSHKGHNGSRRFCCLKSPALLCAPL